jgi:transcriptional regulator with XRE-family HTH domain
LKLGDKILELRVAAKMSQDDLADILDVARQTISNWENNRALPDAGKIVALCQVFDVHSDYLLSLGEEETAATDALEKKRQQNAKKTNIAIIVALVVLALIIVALVIVLTSSEIDFDLISSTVELTLSSGLIVAIVLCALALLSLIVLLIVKNFKK